MKHQVGTRYSNSETYDQATDEVVYGYQVFEQCRPDGSLTGRKSFIDNDGTLCSIEIAETKRLQSILYYAHELLGELKSIVANSNGDKNTGYFDVPVATINNAKYIIAKVEGISK